MTKSSEQFLRELCDAIRKIKLQDIKPYMPDSTLATYSDFANALEDAADEIAALRKRLSKYE